MIDRKKKQVSEIIFRKYPHIALVYLFGSRVDGDIVSVQGAFPSEALKA